MDAVLFAARRLGEDPVAVVVSARTGTEAGRQVAAGLDELVLGRLNARDARALLERSMAAAVERLAPGQARSAVAGDRLRSFDAADVIAAGRTEGGAEGQPPMTPMSMRWRSSRRVKRRKSASGTRSTRRMAAET